MRKYLYFSDGISKIEFFPLFYSEDDIITELTIEYGSWVEITKGYFLS